MLLSQRLRHQSRQTHAYRATRNYFASMESRMQLTGEEDRKEREYGQKAQDFVRKLDPGLRNNLPTIKVGTQEWKAWERYFVGHLGFSPWAMQRAGQQHLMGNFDAVMTVPSQWPEWFDTEYAASKVT